MYACFHRQRWQTPDVPAEPAEKRVICACIREICFFRFSMRLKVINFRCHFWLGIFIQDNLSLNCLKGQIWWQHSNARGFADKENPIISCLLISTAYEHPNSDKAMIAGVCHIFDSYINVWISGQSAQDSHCWYLWFSFDCLLMSFVWRFYLLVGKILQAERNIMTKYLVYGHNWER